MRRTAWNAYAVWDGDGVGPGSSYQNGDGCGSWSWNSHGATGDGWSGDETVGEVLLKFQYEEETEEEQ